MTRWARANNVHKHKPAEATPWNQLRAAGRRGAGRDGAPSTGPSQRDQRDPLRRTCSSSGIKPNRKKKEYISEDVNGFLEYLNQSGQARPAGKEGEQGTERDLRDMVEVAMKKDQRREDRRVKRQRDKKNNMVCFNCRKPGHGLADCPEADRDEEMGRGICFRCGSTEHEIHKCRAKVDPALGEYPYAKCFICGQTGHLSRSCPDNPKGLYAQGGCCRVCGSVEHFQKDCPEHQAATNSMTLGWLSNNMSADLEDVHIPVKKAKPKQPKVITF
ncbi:zinc finger CCHC domain-containing protein 9-like isoform X2 [Fundulus heteroclitus]|nr:zinc finger CCHC domain-containing protein 9-like isoform X2 [Fundulus heteroclitus]XP_035990316.1 zinc finger CCHC domain-containing protein 9-like isoform X2 [Fundulus heteroclitus]